MQNFKDALHAYTYIGIHRWYNIGGENNADISIFIKTEFKEDESGKFAISMLTSG